MRSFTWIAVVAVVLGAGLVLGPFVAAGEDTGRPNENPKATKTSEGSQDVGDLALAQMLAAYGRRTQDPLALLTAARIMKNTPSDEMKAEPKTLKQEGAGEAKEKAESGTKPATVEQLLSEATSLAGENATLAALAKWVAEEKGRGTPQGAHCGTHRLDARSYQEFEETFIAGETARVVLRGDGDTDLDLHIYDENGNLIDSDADGTDFCVCEWVPRWTGPFTIRVSNLGLVWNQYTICTN